MKRLRPRARDVPLYAGLFVIVVVAVYFGYQSLQDYEESKTRYNSVESLSHIHALGLQADDPHKVYIATHDGLIRSYHDREWGRVGIVKDDIEAFSAHPSEPLTFFAGGHEGRANAGLRVSTDGGFTWRTIALDDADVHAIAISRANPEYVWAYEGSTLHASLNGGETWRRIQAAIPPILGLAADRTRAATIFAATPDGVQRSDDGGTTWRVSSAQPATAIAAHPTTNGTLMMGTSDGSVLLSRDEGDTWTDLGIVSGEPIAGLVIDPDDAATFYAATADGVLYKSESAGRSWERLDIE